MEGSLLVLCWWGESITGFMEVQGLWIVLDLQWSFLMGRCSWICEGCCSWCSHGLVSDLLWRSYLCESRFVACAWRKCSLVYRSTLTRVNGGVTSTGVASRARESNGTMAAKCRCSTCGFSQCSVVLRRGLWLGSNKRLWCLRTSIG